MSAKKEEAPDNHSIIHSTFLCIMCSILALCVLVVRGFLFFALIPVISFYLICLEKCEEAGVKDFEPLMKGYKKRGLERKINMENIYCSIIHMILCIRNGNNLSISQPNE